jgi:hypothetical protein
MLPVGGGGTRCGPGGKNGLPNCGAGARQPSIAVSSIAIANAIKHARFIWRLLRATALMQPALHLHVRHT